MRCLRPTERSATSPPPRDSAPPRAVGPRESLKRSWRATRWRARRTKSRPWRSGSASSTTSAKPAHSTPSSPKVWAWVLGLALAPVPPPSSPRTLPADSPKSSTPTPPARCRKLSPPLSRKLSLAPSHKRSTPTLHRPPTRLRPTPGASSSAAWPTRSSWPRDLRMSSPPEGKSWRGWKTMARCPAPWTPAHAASSRCPSSSSTSPRTSTLHDGSCTRFEGRARGCIIADLSTPMDATHRDIIHRDAVLRALRRRRVCSPCPSLLRALGQATGSCLGGTTAGPRPTKRLLRMLRVPLWRYRGCWLHDAPWRG
mmetsp:Transcript_21593/g.46994  ORF Transcript_21593/g.46994 Transcript_21593/m.46994 type:complete len:312 (-) Transcript_21593:179-1114(-)